MRAARLATKLASTLRALPFVLRKCENSCLVRDMLLQEDFASRSPIPPISMAELFARFPGNAGALAWLPPLSPACPLTSSAKRHVLAALVASAAPTTIAEFGTYLGVDTRILALNAPRSRVVTFDASSDGYYHPQLRPDIGVAFRNRPESHQITQVIADPRTLDATVHLTGAEFVLVHGGHSRAHVVADTENALRLLSPGGLLVWDHYYHEYSGVVGWLNELSIRLPLRRIIGTTLVVKADQCAPSAVPM